jgi:hypothetical protein
VQGFVKVVKTKAYFKRFQTKFRRRRGKFSLFSLSSPKEKKKKKKNLLG